MIAAGTTIGGRYRVVRHIGGGGMKQVYLAEDTRLADRPCALAEMLDSIADPAERQSAAASFQREADMLARLEHENIVRIYDRLSDGNRHYLAMEYVEGETLEQKLERAPGKQLDENTAIDAALQILAALEYLHGRNPPVVYRDLKPANAIVRANGGIKLIDFGIARLFVPKMTATMVGTQGYAPPEQYEGKAEPRSDVYALGVTMFQLLTGWDPAVHPPFMFPPIRSLRPDLNPALAGLIGEALELDLNRRIASATEFRRRLENLAGVPAQPSLRMPPLVSVQPPMFHDAPTVRGLSSSACPSCGKPVPADAQFCPYCSAGLSAAPAPPKPPWRRPILLAGAFATLAAIGFAATYYHLRAEQARAAGEAVRLRAQQARAAGEAVRLRAEQARAAGEAVRLRAQQARAAGEAVRLRAEQARAAGEEVHTLYAQYVKCKGDSSCIFGLLAAPPTDKIRELAASGDAKAQTLLGVMYYNGDGAPKDYGAAVKWYRKAADQGVARAENNLGVMYVRGDGVPKDYGAAVKWYRKAADQGVAQAEYNLGVMYANGEDYGAAVKWYRKAADQGFAEAETSLGFMYLYGYGVPKDHAAAMKWLHKAANDGSEDAKSMLTLLQD